MPDSADLPSSLSQAIIHALPETAYYIPNFISEEEEQFLLSKVLSAPLPVWKNLSHRRLQTYPSPLSPQNVLLGAPLPPWLFNPIIPRLLSIPVSSCSNEGGLFINSPHQSPNHVLINEYLPGQGILPHEDGPAYYPIVATVSLDGHTVLDIYEKKSNDSGERESTCKWRILQEPRSLLVSTGRLYEDTLHGIAEVHEDDNLETCVNWDLLGDRKLFETTSKRRETRISLTFRDVLKVKNIGKGLKFLQQGKS